MNDNSAIRDLEVVVIASIHEYFSGGGMALFNSILALRKKYKIEVYLTNSGTLQKALSHSEIPVFLVKEFGKLDLTYPLRLFLLLRNKVKNNTLIVTHTERTSVLVNPFFYTIGYRVATVIHRSITSGSPWENNIKTYIFSALENTVLRWFTGIVLAVSDSLKNELTQKRNIQVNKVFTLSNYVDLESIEIRNEINEKLSLNVEMSMRKPSSDHFNVTSILRNNLVKGADFFNSEAFEKLLEVIKSNTMKKIVVYLISDSLNELFYAKSRAICAKHDVDLILTGPVKGIHSYLSNTDIYVQPSRDEAFGLAAIESSLYGCVLLTTNITSFRKTFNDYKSFQPIIVASASWYISPENLEGLKFSNRSHEENSRASYKWWRAYKYGSNQHLNQFEVITSLF